MNQALSQRQVFSVCEGTGFAVSLELFCISHSMHFTFGRHIFGGDLDNLFWDFLGLIDS